MTQEPKTEPRDYIVLVRQHEGTTMLQEIGPVQAGGAHAAIRKAVAEHNVDPQRTARYIAIPLRNWTETEGGLDKPEPKFRLRDTAYVPPAQRAQEGVKEPEPKTEED